MSYKVRIEPFEQLALFDVRGSVEEVENLLSALSLPAKAQSILRVPDTDALAVRIGPRRCLLQASLSQETHWTDELKRLTSGRLIDAVAVSDMYQGISVSGDEAQDVLSQVVSLNLHEFSIGGACATEIFELAGYLFRVESDRYIIFVESSYSDYVWTRLTLCSGGK